jgi:thymidylate synthase (FAD)
MNIDIPWTVLDKGFVRVKDIMGNDGSIVEAARVSYGKGTKSVREDRGLIRYLYRHKHTTPFEMCEIKFHIKCPIFVARQWIRHRTANVNEYSARYSILSDEFYTPRESELLKQSTKNKQGREEKFNSDETKYIKTLIEENSEDTYQLYENLIEMKLTNELSRMVLPVNVYTEFYWKIDLHNLFHFLKLRTDPHAQWEIRQYADRMEKIVGEWVPIAYEAWVDYSKEAVTFSKQQIEAIRECVDLKEITEYAERVSDMSDREIREMVEVLK